MKPQYTSNEIYEFENTLEEYSLLDSFKGSGKFLSLLLARCDEDLNLGSKGLNNLGEDYGRGKTIEFDGDVGDFVGCRMSSGKIIVKGAAGQRAGYAMEGGIVVITSDVGGSLGSYMGGGNIFVYGYPTSSGMAHEMSGGEIHLESASLDLDKVKGLISSEMKKGKVYLRDKIIAFK